MIKEITSLFFSATGTTQKVVSHLAHTVAQELGSDTAFTAIDFTLPMARTSAPSFSADDLVIVGVPVYAGRVPNVLLKYINSLNGNGAVAVAVVLYGNRNYDDALIELTELLRTRGFTVIAAGAFVGEHAFSYTLAQNRPDSDDMQVVHSFGASIAEKLNNENFNPPEVSGHLPYRDYYKPKNLQGEPVDIRKVKPKTDGRCTDCRTCIEVCPMGSIDQNDPSLVSGICIKCGSCIKKCPVGAKFFDDPDFVRHKEELEQQFALRNEPELFV